MGDETEVVVALTLAPLLPAGEDPPVEIDALARDLLPQQGKLSNIIFHMVIRTFHNCPLTRLIKYFIL